MRNSMKLGLNVALSVRVAGQSPTSNSPVNLSRNLKEVNVSDEQRTCPECNCKVEQGRCTNRDGCAYRGPGWTPEQRRKAWAQHGVEERTVGAQYDHTGRG